jgi:urease accessory protein UreH
MLILADAPDIGPLLNGLGGETRRWDDVKGGVATLPGGDGLAVRVIGDETPSVQAALISSWSIARKRILGKDVPSLRKY